MTKNDGIANHASIVPDPKLTWRQDNKSPGSDQEKLLKVNIPVRDRRTGPHFNLKAEVCKNGSLESTGRRIVLFTRLAEECSIADFEKEKDLASDA